MVKIKLVFQVAAPFYTTSLRKGDSYLKHNSLMSTIPLVIILTATQPVSPLGLAPNPSPSFRLAQAIFRASSPYVYPNILNLPFFTPTCLWRWDRQNVLKHWHVHCRRRWITQKKADKEILSSRAAHFFHRCTHHLKILDTRRVTCCSHHKQDPKIWCANMQNLVTQATWHARFLHSCFVDADVIYPVSIPFAN
jgi:hypothetical protein